MTQGPQQIPPLFTHVDVSAQATGDKPGAEPAGDVMGVLSQILAAQDRQNELLEELVQQMTASQKQRANELGQWKQANPELARQCREAAETLGDVQTEFLRCVTEEINENADSLMDGEFMLNEFVDRFGPRLAHLNGVLQVLSQLSSANNAN